MLDLQLMFSGKRQIPVNVALRIDHRRRPRRLVSNQIGSVRQARQIELL
jgi:hypothetical protein